MATYGIVKINESAIAVSFPHLEDFELDVLRDIHYRSGNLTIKNVVHLLRANPQLKSLGIAMNFKMRLHTLLNLIIDNPAISTLKFYTKVRSVKAVEVNRLASEHPLIEELTFFCGQFRVDIAMMIIRQLKFLKLFTFRFKNQTDCDRLLNELDQKWQHKVSHKVEGTFEVILSC